MRSFSPSRWALLSSQGKRTLPPFGFGNLLNWDFQWLIFYISSNSVQEFHNFFTVIYSVCACSVMSDSLRPHGLSPPGSSCHGIFQARIVEWVAIFSSGDLPDPEIKLASLMSPALAGRQVLYPWGAWEAPHLQQNSLKKSCLELLSPVFLFPVSEAHSKQFSSLPLFHWKRSIKVNNDFLILPAFLIHFLFFDELSCILSYLTPFLFLFSLILPSHSTFWNFALLPYCLILK